MRGKSRVESVCARECAITALFLLLLLLLRLLLLLTRQQRQE